MNKEMQEDDDVKLASVIEQLTKRIETLELQVRETNQRVQELQNQQGIAQEGTVTESREGRSRIRFKVPIQSVSGRSLGRAPTVHQEPDRER